MTVLTLEILRKRGLIDFLKVVDILERNNINYWLDYGTLLGAVRDGRIIPWDGEFDISIWESELPLLLGILPEFRKLGFEIDLHDSKNFDKNMRYSNIKLYNYKNNIGNFAIDIHMYIEREGMAVRPFGLKTKNYSINKLFGIISSNSHLKVFDIISNNRFDSEIKYSFTEIYGLLMQKYESVYIEEELLKLPFYFQKGAYSNRNDFKIMIKNEVIVSSISLPNKNNRLSKYIINKISEFVAFLPYKIIIYLNPFMQGLTKIIPLKNDKLVTVRKDYFKNFERHRFHGHMIPVPKDYNLYLDELYGEWQVPRASIGADNVSSIFQKVD